LLKKAAYCRLLKNRNAQIGPALTYILRTSKLKIEFLENQKYGKDI